MKMKRKHHSEKGQAIVEYIIIIVIVAVSALTVMGIFSDRIRTIIAGASNSLGAEGAEEAIQTGAADILKNMDASGIDDNH